MNETGRMKIKGWKWTVQKTEGVVPDRPLWCKWPLGLAQDRPVLDELSTFVWPSTLRNVHFRPDLFSKQLSKYLQPVFLSIFGFVRWIEDWWNCFKVKIRLIKIWFPLVDQGLIIFPKFRISTIELISWKFFWDQAFSFCCSSIPPFVTFCPWQNFFNITIWIFSPINESDLKWTVRRGESQRSRESGRSWAILNGHLHQRTTPSVL